MPAGCQYLVSPLLDPNLAGTGVSGKVSSSAPASGSAVVAETVPLEAPAPGTHITDTELSYNASVPAPMLMRAPENSTAAAQIVPQFAAEFEAEFAAQVAALNGTTVGSQAKVKLLCKPITARGDPRHLSDDDLVWIGLGVMAGIVIIVLCCLGCCASESSSSEVQDTKENSAAIASVKESSQNRSLDMVD